MGWGGVCFNSFFQSGMGDGRSPFLTKNSRNWAINLKLKAAILSAVTLTIAFVLSFAEDREAISRLFLLFTYFLAGTPAIIDSIEDLVEFNINIDVLMTSAAFSSVLLGSPFEGALLLVLFAISGAMEKYVNQRAIATIQQIHKLKPTKATIIDKDGQLHERSIDDISVDSEILVRAGEMVPLDGEVVRGASLVNMVHLSGENTPKSKDMGDEVPAGARTIDGSITLKVLRKSSDSTLAKIIELIQSAKESKPKIQRWFDSLVKSYSMAIMGLAAFFACTLPFVWEMPFVGVGGSIYRALAFLIAASPCALIIATPIAYLSSISAAARRGILLKGGTTFDALAECSILAVDKTGTLTTGKLRLKQIIDVGPSQDFEESLKCAASLERHAKHPIASAVLSACQDRNLRPYALKDFLSQPGHGLEATVETDNGPKACRIGRLEYVLNALCPTNGEQLKALFNELKAEGWVVAALAVENQASVLCFDDTIRSSVSPALQNLKSHFSYRIAMLTGDHKASATPVAEKLGIDELYTDLKPEEKLQYIEKLGQSGNLVMVGDGINDAPALARAHVGIAMGEVGSGTALEAANIILLHDNIDDLHWLVKKARDNRAIVNQNLMLATGVIIGAGVTALIGAVPLWLAVILHEGGTVLVGLNGLRLLR